MFSPGRCCIITQHGPSRHPADGDEYGRQGAYLPLGEVQVAVPLFPMRENYAKNRRIQDKKILTVTELGEAISNDGISAC